MLRLDVEQEGHNISRVDFRVVFHGETNDTTGLQCVRLVSQLKRHLLHRHVCFCFLPELLRFLSFHRPFLVWHVRLELLPVSEGVSHRQGGVRSFDAGVNILIATSSV